MHFSISNNELILVLYDMRDLRKISKYLMIWFIANLLNDWYEFDEFIGWKLQLKLRYIFLSIELKSIHTKVHYLSFEFDDVFPSDIYIKMPEVVIYSLNKCVVMRNWNFYLSLGYLNRLCAANLQRVSNEVISFCMFCSEYKYPNQYLI